jgi:hypothetical protein
LNLLSLVPSVFSFRFGESDAGGSSALIAGAAIRSIASVEQIHPDLDIGKPPGGLLIQRRRAVMKQDISSYTSIGMMQSFLHILFYPPSLNFDAIWISVSSKFPILNFLVSTLPWRAESSS